MTPDWLAQLTPPSSKCGRPTKSGAPCKRMRMTSVAPVRADGYVSPSCSTHATGSEILENAHVHALEEDYLREYHKQLPVACWSWPVTDEHRARAAEAIECQDPDRAYELARRLLREWQDGRCGVCGGATERLDHDHQTGLVRGWLCQCCNVGEGFADMPSGRFERYRRRYPTIILGVTFRYHDPFNGWAKPEPEREELDQMARRAGLRLAALLAE